MMRDHTHQLKPALCPNCGVLVDRATNAENADNQPRPGDISMCIKCGVLLRWNDDMSMHVITQQEIRSFTDDQCKLILALVLARENMRRQGLLAKSKPMVKQ